MSRNKALATMVQDLLSVPDKAKKGDENTTLEGDLGIFLVKNGYIRGVNKKNSDWSFVYHSKTKVVEISDKGMPHHKWEDCIFKMGVNKETGEHFFPTPMKETRKYRFLHEASHAYQEFLAKKESSENPQDWHQKALQGKIITPYSALFVFCYQKRLEDMGSEKECSYCARGLSIWGNAPVYDYKNNSAIINKESEMAVRAQEDVNELVTMYIWHPEYLYSYLDYLSLNYENNEIREREITKEDVVSQNLIVLSREEAQHIKYLVKEYVREMKEFVAIKTN